MKLLDALVQVAAFAVVAVVVGLIVWPLQPVFVKWLLRYWPDLLVLGVVGWLWWYVW